MDYLTKNLSVNKAEKLIDKLINNSEIDIIENFWLKELDNCYLSKKDSIILNKLFQLKNDKTEPSISMYKNCIKEEIISNLLKKNWRRLFNNNVIDKYYAYLNFEPRTTNQEKDVQLHPRTTNLLCCEPLTTKTMKRLV